MGIYEELQARGLIAQVTDEERIRELVNNGKATFYIGFDPTADSLHVCLLYTSGVLSMARAMHPDSAGSQFFIMHKNSPHLDGQYAAFGKIIEGMDIVDKIATVQTDFRDRPLQEQKMKKVTVDTQGTEYPEPEKA